MKFELIVLNPWSSGRQKGGYAVLPLFGIKINDRYVFDILMLRYEEGNFINPHRDPEVLARLNLELIKPVAGGIFNLRGKCWKLGRLTVFRPTQVHSVSEILEGRRLVFSIGIGNWRKFEEAA